jgi:hypothetical protein
MKKAILVFIIFLIPIRLQAEIIFETDFSLDTGWAATTRSGVWQQAGTPNGWTAYRVPGSGGADLFVETGTGKNSSNALKISWTESPSTSLAVSLAKHLTGDQDTGYDEVYIRYHVKFDDNWKSGINGSDTNYWKWGRLHQNTHVTDQSQWTENRPFSRYVVWTYNGQPNPYINAVWADNDNAGLGSVAGPRIQMHYGPNDVGQGHFESIDDWVIDRNDNLGSFIASTQNWHTLEYRFKLATDLVNGDGVFEVWLDGIKQEPWGKLVLKGGATGYTGIPTESYTGFNWFIFFDNMAKWSAGWNGTNRYILVNDVVVSDEYIGHDYVVGQPSPPPNLSLQ